uniref:Uncharacterized protein n=1 Tax=Rhizophagus irregularis (strain DAOM 181602 / DAOM 197198 / MUCL 43194) TaxID=747089 RepID=U9SPA4_RHIID
MESEKFQKEKVVKEKTVGRQETAPIRYTGFIGQCERDFTESHLDTSPQRIYSELVVDEIDKYRKGVEDDAPISTVASKKLQKDYVTTDEAVKIINDHREKNFEEERIPYKKYDPYMEWEAIEKDAVRMEKTKRRLHGGIT